MYLCCRLLTQQWCALFISLCNLVVVVVPTASGAKVLLPWSSTRSNNEHQVEEGPHLGLERSLCEVDLPLPKIRTSLESSNMLNNNLDIQSKTTLNIYGILIIPWNTSSTCSPNKLATDLSITCIKGDSKSRGI